MNKQQIQAEHDRLRPILFEGAPDWCIYATMDIDGEWHYHNKEPLISPDPNYYGWCLVSGCYQLCKNQPETTLDWKDSLIRRDGVMHE